MWQVTGGPPALSSEKCTKEIGASKHFCKTCPKFVHRAAQDAPQPDEPGLRGAARCNVREGISQQRYKELEAEIAAGFQWVDYSEELLRAQEAILADLMGMQWEEEEKKELAAAYTEAEKKRNDERDFRLQEARRRVRGVALVANVDTGEKTVRRDRRVLSVSRVLQLSLTNERADDETADGRRKQHHTHHQQRAVCHDRHDPHAGPEEG